MQMTHCSEIEILIHLEFIKKVLIALLYTHVCCSVSNFYNSNYCKLKIRSINICPQINGRPLIVINIFCYTLNHSTVNNFFIKINLNYSLSFLERL